MSNISKAKLAIDKISTVKTTYEIELMEVSTTIINLAASSKQLAIETALIMARAHNISGWHSNNGPELLSIKKHYRQ